MFDFLFDFNLALLVPFILLLVAGIVICNRALDDARERLSKLAQDSDSKDEHTEDCGENIV